jgi:hypothetical protein
MKKWLLFGWFGVLFSCREVKFSPERPLAVSVYAYRHSFEAVKTQNRLIDRGLPAYVVCLEQPQTGRWFHVLVGAAKNETEIRTEKMRFEDKAGLQCALTLINFSKIKPLMVEIENSRSQTQARTPDITPQVMKLIERLPYLDAMRIEKLKIYNQITSFNLTRLAEKPQIDWPRGWQNKLMLLNAASFAEVNFKDELLNDEINLVLVNLKNECSLCFFPDLTKEMSSRIVETKKYKHKVLQAVEFKDKTTLKGYYIEVSQKPNSPKIYLILTDPLQSFLYVLQSPKNSKSKLFYVGDALSKASKITNYEAFTNLFTTLPAIESSQEHLLYLGFENLSGFKGRNRALYRESYEQNVLSYNPEKGLFRYSVIDFGDTLAARVVYQDQTKLSARSYPFEMNGGQGKIFFSFQKRANQALPRFAHLKTGTQVSYFQNYNDYPLDSTDFKAKLFRYQLGTLEIKKKTKFW